MQESSLRILAQAGLSGVFFAAKILRGELPHYRLPLPEFAAKILPCSAPLTVLTSSESCGCSGLSFATFFDLMLVQAVTATFWAYYKVSTLELFKAGCSAVSASSQCPALTWYHF